MREDRDAVFAVKNRLKHSQRYKDAYITKDYTRAIQEERETLTQAMYVAKERGCDAKVINRTLYINKEAFNVTNIPHDFRPTAPQFPSTESYGCFCPAFNLEPALAIPGHRSRFHCSLICL